MDTALSFITLLRKVALKRHRATASIRIIGGDQIKVKRKRVIKFSITMFSNNTDGGRLGL